MGLPLITVFGATGRLGGSVASALLADGRWAVRAVTREPEAPAAQALARRGAALCRADLDEPASLQAALRGAEAAFCLAAYREHGDAARTLRQARHLADAAEAAQAAALRGLIWLTWEDTRRCGPLPVPCMDACSEANTLFLERELPVTLLLSALPWEDVIEAGLRRGAGGLLELALPLGAAALPGIAAADIGACAAALFAAPPAQRRVGIAGEHLGGAALAAALGEALGEPVRWRDLPLAELGLQPGGAERRALFAFLQRAHGACCAARPVAASRALHPGLLDFRAWLASQAPRLAASSSLSRTPA